MGGISPFDPSELPGSVFGNQIFLSPPWFYEFHIVSPFLLYRKGENHHPNKGTPGPSRVPSFQHSRHNGAVFIWVPGTSAGKSPLYNF